MSRTGENIYKRKDGRWEARYIDSYDGNGKAKYKYLYAPTYTEVKAKLLSILLPFAMLSVPIKHNCP